MTLLFSIADVDEAVVVADLRSLEYDADEDVEDLRCLPFDKNNLNFILSYLIRKKWCEKSFIC